MKSSADAKYNFLRIYGTLCLVIGVIGCVYFIGTLLEQELDHVVPGALALAGVFAMGFVCLSTADNSSRISRLESSVKELKDKRLKEIEKDLPEPNTSVDRSPYFSQQVTNYLTKGEKK